MVEIVRLAVGQSPRITVLLKALHNVVRYLITLFFAEALAQSANKLECANAIANPNVSAPVRTGAYENIIRTIVNLSHWGLS
jgi:hypothetical protein